MPVFTLAFVYGAPIFKMLRSQMEIALDAEYTTYGEALGPGAAHHPRPRGARRGRIDGRDRRHGDHVPARRRRARRIGIQHERTSASTPFKRSSQPTTRRSRLSCASPRSSPCSSTLPSICSISPWIRGSRSSDRRPDGSLPCGRASARRFANCLSGSWISLVLFAVIIVLTAIGPDLAPYSTISASPSRPAAAAGSAAHWLGTDDNGIDILSRLLAAPRTDVVIAVSRRRSPCSSDRRSAS